MKTETYVTEYTNRMVKTNYMNFCIDYNIPWSKDGYEIYCELKKTHITNDVIAGIMLV